MYSCAEDPLYHPVDIKDIQRFWKRILIVDEYPDVTVTFKVGIKDTNNSAEVNKRIDVHTLKSSEDNVHNVGHRSTE